MVTQAKIHLDFLGGTTLHQHIRQQREALGLSLETLGHRVGIQSSYLERVEEGLSIPKPDVARRLAQALNLDESEYIQWAQERGHGSWQQETSRPSYPRYPEAREALIALCHDPAQARQLFQGSSIGPLEAALYGLLVDRMSSHMGDLGFWGFVSPQQSLLQTPDAHLLLEAFFEMLMHPEGETADYTNVFSALIDSWQYGPGPHRITVTETNQQTTTYRLALVDQEGSIIPALEPEDPFHALYRMMTPAQRADLSEIARVLLRRDGRIEIQAALQALSQWHDR